MHTSLGLRIGIGIWSGAGSKQENVHGVALRARSGVVWLLDSNHAGPERLDWDHDLYYLVEYAETYGSALL